MRAARTCVNEAQHTSKDAHHGHPFEAQAYLRTTAARTHPNPTLATRGREGHR